ncbi:RNA12 protein-domain-containing protein [Mycotypha africana]|uniref:RNA12 protein-domain-containing protein n=1 Tax=Mycotypha africana TaxID=64632 RepID=UPI002301275E|nr:RNA12 protein-domain-containing protein [Mycotypha africana]KAI8968296.1 RNA12 protein-domain-containing protein [Mycotypha africana]
MLSNSQNIKYARLDTMKRFTCLMLRPRHYTIVQNTPHVKNKIIATGRSPHVYKTMRAETSVSKPLPTSMDSTIRKTNGEAMQDQTTQLYLDNVFPLKISSIDFRQWFFRRSKHFLENRVHQAIPSNELPNNFSIQEIMARTKDGGAIVTFAFRSTESNKYKVAKDIVDRINEYIQKNKIVAPFNFQQVRAFIVKGSPFMEDILARYPTQRIRIEFQGEPVNVEKLYTHLRPFGRMFDIALYPNPFIAKDPARYAIVQFTRVRSATSARNCLHGQVIDGTRLNILYERQLRPNVVKDWLVNHPRITVPLFAAIFAGVTYAIFDPIRVFFITSDITQRFNPEEYAIYRWLRNETWNRLMPGSARDLTTQHHSLWADDTEQIGRLKSWLAETPETFLVVTGHKGSGKSALVKSALKDRKNKLFIDCEAIGNARNQSELTKNLAKEVGYFPVFTWMSSISRLVDTAVAATTGQKAGLSTSPDSQIKSILETVAISLRDIVTDEKEARLREREHANQQSLISKLKKLITGRDYHQPLIRKDLENEKKARKKEHGKEGVPNGDSEEQDVKSIPIVVIDNYMYRETNKNAKLWEELAEWAALLIENEIAHVIFVSSNAGVMKLLGKALPGKSFSTVSLSDAPPEIALSFIQKQLGSEMEDPYLRDIVGALGGRLTELELLVQKMRMQMDAQTAFEDIVSRNMIEIRKYGFGDAVDDYHKIEWTPTQFWAIVKRLTQSASINYDELKWGPEFSGDDNALKSMERAELILITQKEGRPHAIKPGKPIYYTVFNRLVSDTVFAASMEIDNNMVLKKKAEQEMTKLEDTIQKLASISPKPPKEIDERIRYLLSKLQAMEKSIEEYDANISKAKKIVSEAWVPDEEDY